MDFPVRSVSHHNAMAHGAASASKSLATAPGSVDAATDLDGGDDAFAAILAQVAPQAATPKADARAHAHHKSEQSSEFAASDPDSTDSASDVEPSTGSKPLADPSRSTAKNARLAADPLKISLQADSDSTDAVQKPEPKSTHRAKNADTKTADAKTKKLNDSDTGQALADMTAANPQPAAFIQTPPLSVAAIADEQGDDAEPQAAPIDSLQALSGAPSANPARAQGKTGASKSTKDPQTADSDAPSGTGDGADTVADKPSHNPLDSKPVANLSAPVLKDPAHGDTRSAHATAPQAATAGTDNAGPAPAQGAPSPATAPVRAEAQATPSAAPVLSAAAQPATATSTPSGTRLTLQAAPQSAVLPNLNSFALNIAASSHAGLKQFDIRMDPAELGRVEVRLSIDDTGKMQAHLTADRPQTLDLLQKDSTNLRSALRDAGLNVAQNGLNFSLKGQNSEQRSGGNSASPRGRSLSIRTAAAIDAAQNVIPVRSYTGADTRLDIHV